MRRERIVAEFGGIVASRHRHRDDRPGRRVRFARRSTHRDRHRTARSHLDEPGRWDLHIGRGRPVPVLRRMDGARQADDAESRRFGGDHARRWRDERGEVDCLLGAVRRRSRRDAGNPDLECREGAGKPPGTVVDGAGGALARGRSHRSAHAWIHRLVLGQIRALDRLRGVMTTRPGGPLRNRARVRCV